MRCEAPRVQFVYERRRPEKTTLYAVVRDNVETLYAATSESGVELAAFVRAELEGYLDCGMLCRGCASSLRRVQRGVLPEAPLRQWVLTVPHALRDRLAYDGKLLGKVTRAFVGAVLAFYKKRSGASGAVAVVQRTSSDLKLNPHVHAVFLDGGYVDETFTAHGHLRGSEVAEVLAKTKRRIERVLARADVRNLVRIALKKPFSDGTVVVDMDPLSLLLRLCAAVPAPRFHTVRYAGVLASASQRRPKIVPQPKPPDADADAPDASKKKGCRYWPWAELMARSFELDVKKCPSCGARMKLIALVQDKESLASFMRMLGQPIDAPPRAPARDPPYYRSAVIRRLTTGDLAVA